jgi:hypothetical protein
MSLARWAAGAGVAGAVLLGASLAMHVSPAAPPAKARPAPAAMLQAPLPDIPRAAAESRPAPVADAAPPALAGAPDQTPALIFDESDGKTEQLATLDAVTQPRTNAFKGGPNGSLAPALEGQDAAPPPR